MSLITELIILFATSAAASFGGWLFARRKKKAEATAAEIGNLDLIADMWQRTAQSFQSSYNDILAKNEEIAQELSRLNIEKQQLADKVHKLEIYVKDLQCNNKALEQRLKGIRKQHDDSTKNEN